MLLSLAVCVALAAPLEENADFADGQRLYGSFEFEKASFRFRAAARHPDLMPPDRARAHLWLGLALAQAGDDIAARGAFVDALRIDDTIALPDDAPPSLRPIFADARASALAAGPATVAPSGDVAPPPPPKEEEPRAMPLPAVVGAAVAGIGVVVIGVAGVVGLAAVDQAEQARNQQFQSDAIAGFKDATATATTANVLFAVGGAAILGGAAAAAVSPLLE